MNKENLEVDQRALLTPSYDFMDDIIYYYV